MNRFGDVGFGDVVGSFEVGEGARDAKDFVVGAGAEAETVDGQLKELRGRLAERAVFADGGGVDLRVRGEGAVVAVALDVARGLYLLADLGGAGPGRA